MKSKLFQATEDNPLFWGMIYCPHHFRSEFAPFHYNIMEFALRYRYLGIAAPRESSKTTIMAFLYPIHRICYQKKRFIIVVTSVYSKSCGILDTIKKEIKDTPLIKAEYRMQIRRDAEGDTIFAHPNGFETRVLCKGRDQIGSIRGEKFGAYRPDLIITDDIEDDEMVRNPERRRELKDLYDQVLLLAGERRKLQVISIGTILHDDSQMAKLVDPEQYPDFSKFCYRGLNITDKGEESLWEEKWTVPELKAKEAADPVTFAKEIQNDPVAGRVGAFKKDDFRYWKIDNLNYVLFGNESEVVARGSLTDCKAAIACDLAWDERREHDFSAIIPAFLTPQSDILVDHYLCKKGLRPDELEETLYAWEQRLRSITGGIVPIGMEKAKLEKVMRWLLKQAARKRNHYLILKDLLWDKDKITRITTRLASRYINHTIYHRQGMGELEYQLLRVPSGTHDDLPDALQGVVQLLGIPKKVKREPDYDDEFMWWRKLSIDSKKPKRDQYVFGSKGRRHGIPATKSFR